MKTILLHNRDTYDNLFKKKFSSKPFSAGFSLLSNTLKIGTLRYGMMEDENQTQRIVWNATFHAWVLHFFSLQKIRLNCLIVLLNLW